VRNKINRKNENQQLTKAGKADLKEETR